jgi:hypothetical protein
MCFTEKFDEKSGIPSQRKLSDGTGGRSLALRGQPALSFSGGTAQFRRTLNDTGTNLAAKSCGGPK